MFATTRPYGGTGYDALPVCLGGENPNGLVSLLNVLQIYAHRFVKLLENLQVAEDCCAAREPHFDTLIPLLRYLDDDCGDLQLVTAQKQLIRIRVSFAMALEKQKATQPKAQLERKQRAKRIARTRASIDLAELKVLLAELHTRILEDLEETVLYQIRADKVSLFFKKVSQEEEMVFVPKTAEDNLD